MEWHNKKFDNSSVANLIWTRKFVSSKCKSDANIIDNYSEMYGDESENDISVIENRGVCDSNSIDERMQSLTPHSQDIQVCLCPECSKDDNIQRFRTREISTLRLVVQGPEILNYQGYRHSPEDIAQFWKKDSRMWLWKSIRSAQKNKNKSKSLTRFPTVANESINKH